MAAPQPFNERFTEERFSRSITRPTSRNVVVQRRGGRQNPSKTAQQSAAATMQAAGSTLQVTGKSAKVTGIGLQRAGVALSSTGIGAIVGAPLAAAGTATRVAGTGMDTTGKALRRGAARVKKIKGVDAAAEDKKKVSKANLKIWMTLFGFWPFQVFLAVVSMVSMAVMSVTEGISEQVDSNGVTRFVSSVFGFIGNTLAEGIRTLTGFDINGFLELLNPKTWFLLTHTMIFSFGILMLGGIILFYFFSGIRPFGAWPKLVAFIVAVMGYATPILNIFPWFLLYTIVVWCNPR